MQPAADHAAIDRDAERDLLGAGMSSANAARRIAEELATYDFTSDTNRAVYRVIAELHVHGREISPAIVYDDLGPDLVSDLELSREDLETWAIDSIASVDANLVEHFIRKLKRLRAHREYRRALSSAADENALTAEGDVKARLTALLEEAADQLGRVFALNGSGPDLRAVDLRHVVSSSLEPPPWVLRGWLAQQDVVILAGVSGAGKSWLLLDLAMALARGAQWLGQIDYVAERPQRVLYVDEEQNEHLVAYRVKRWAHGANLTAERVAALDLRYLVGNGISLDDDRGWARMRQEVDAFRPDWILLDTLVRFHEREENSNSEMAQFFAQRLRPLKAHGAGIVALHHYGKPSKDRGDGSESRLRGASNLKADLDELWALEEEPDSGARILRHDKCRWGQEGYPLRIELEDVREGQGVVVFSPGRADDALELVLNCLAEKGEEGLYRVDAVRVVSAGGFKSPSRTASRHLRDLYDSGRVRKLRVGREMRYYLTSLAPLGAE